MKMLGKGANTAKTAAIVILNQHLPSATPVHRKSSKKLKKVVKNLDCRRNQKIRRLWPGSGTAITVPADRLAADYSDHTAPKCPENEQKMAKKRLIAAKVLETSRFQLVQGEPGVIAVSGLGPGRESWLKGYKNSRKTGKTRDIREKVAISLAPPPPGRNGAAEPGR